jgi:hypothetical protein
LERWPPTYDAEQLRDQIRELAGSEALESRFYVNEPDLVLCQGDVFRMPAPIPLIDEEGEAVALDDVECWMAIGNTCDFARTLEDVQWTQLVPILDLGEATQLAPVELQKLRTYQPYRSFYIPAWSADREDRIWVADLTRPVAAHKQAIQDVATLEARLSQAAWALFHSCLVRFLARDDGRYD